MADPGVAVAADSALSLQANTTLDDAALSAVVASLGMYFRKFGEDMPPSIERKTTAAFLSGHGNLPLPVASCFFAWMASHHRDSISYKTLCTWEKCTQRMWIVLGVVATAAPPIWLSMTR